MATTGLPDTGSAPTGAAPTGAAGAGAFPGGRTPRRGRLVLLVAATLIWAAGLNFLLDHSTWHGLPHRVWYSGLISDGDPAGILLVWLVLVLVLAVTGRLWFTLALTLDLTLIVAAANATKVRMRTEPLYPDDLTFLTSPGFLVRMVPPAQLVVGIAALVVTTAGLLLMGRLATRCFGDLHRAAPPARRPWLRLARPVAALTCLGLLATAHGFNHPGNPWRALFDPTVVRWRTWSQIQNFKANGFVAGTLFNMPVAAMPEPPGYSKERMRQVVARYAGRARALDAHRTPGTLDDVNVVLILSESFSDPTRLHGPTFATDPIPRTRALMRRTTSGHLLVPQYGGGTANVEFEVLTGLSMGLFAPQVTSPYMQILADSNDFPSAVSWFAAHGHDTVAVHPFNTEMYKRKEVYPRLGFQRFVHDRTMQEHRHVQRGRYIDDASAFDEVVHQLHTHDRPLLVNLVTMQNHMPYPGQYDNPIGVRGLPRDKRAAPGQYARGLALTDGSLTRFLARLRASTERTAVVFYGDHLPPGVYPPSIEQVNGNRRVHETPYLIWTSFGTRRQAPPPTTSPTQLLPLLFDQVGEPLTPFYALLRDLRTRLPALEAGRYVRPDDTDTTTPRGLGPAARRVLADYRLVQYDLTVGHRWSEPGLFRDLS